MSSVPSPEESHQRLSYLLPLFINLSLPNTRVNSPLWVRTNGNQQLVINAGYGVGSEAKEGFVPYGKSARAALLFICTEAVRTKNPVITISDSYRGFMSQLGLTWNRKNADEAVRQMQALAASTITLTVTGLSDIGEDEVQATRFVISFKDQMVFNANRSGTISERTPSTIELSADFMKVVVEQGNVPIFTDAWEYLIRHKSALAADIYVWLSYRLYGLKRPSYISWSQLHDQFGSSSPLRAFKHKFLKELESAMLVYPKANISEFGSGRHGGSNGLVLKASEEALLAVWDDLPVRTRSKAK